MPQTLFPDVPLNLATQLLLDSLIEVRRDLYLDPVVAEAWSCDPERCRPRMGPNLCCKVQKRCKHLAPDNLCAIHESKPFSCRLFPLDLVRIGGARVLTSVKNVDFFNTGWCRYDRDMLRCFEGVERSRVSMFEAQREVLAGVFTRAELFLLEKALEEVFP
ncbi:MAG: hypothetical protein HGA98_04495 [Deltaproteobacteria bacterium]|nr:hypothetical protein [Deltaproteobacteria bacterium]